LENLDVKSFKYDFQGWAVGWEIVISTPKAKFHFFSSPKKRRNIVLEWKYVLWSVDFSEIQLQPPNLDFLNKKIFFYQI